MKLSWKLVISFLTLILSAGALFAAKPPALESQVLNNYVPPTDNYNIPLSHSYQFGFAKRLYYPSFNSLTQDISGRVSEFLAEYKEALGLKLDGSDLRLVSSQHSLSGYHFRYQQYHEGVPVFASQVLVNITKSGRISSVISDYRPGVNLSVAPTITVDNAIRIAEDKVKIQQLRDQTKTELNIYPNDGNPVLCWKVLLLAEKPLGDWQVFVDANTGEVVNVKNILCFIDGSGYVFDPNPVVSEQNLNLADSNDQNYQALTNARVDITLRDLNAPQGGFYYLSGPFVNTGPTSNRARSTDPDSFHFNRLDNKFEEVVTYYHIDGCHRFYEALGFDNVTQFSIGVNVNGTTQDNSWYSPGNHQLTFGSGGVDDAEDGDVIIHEYGHATQDNQVPGWGQLEEGGAMGEGFGDYLTVGYFHPVSGGWREAVVFDWDANPRDNFWPGRRVDTNKRYPQDMDGEVHDDGEIWSRCLWDIHNDIGYDTTVQLIIESHFYLSPSADFLDGANAIVQADINLYDGRHLLAIGQSFVDRGIFDEMPIQLEIHHTPLNIVEDLNGPYQILAQVEHTFPIDSLLVYHKNSQQDDFIPLMMTPTGNPDEFSALIPGIGEETDINYYFWVKDSIAITNTLPAGAPNSYFTFHVGPDTMAPTIVHQPLNDMPWVSWPPAITADITDNLGLDSAWVEFKINGGALHSFYLSYVDSSDSWHGIFTDSVVAGDHIEYCIKARDISLSGNVASSPDSGYHAFDIQQVVTFTAFADDTLLIPDGTSQGVADTIVVPDNGQVIEVDVYVDITHPRIGDLIIIMWSPQQTPLVLYNRTGGDSANIEGWYDDDMDPYQNGMQRYIGQNAHGNWRINFSDRVTGNIGQVNRWGIRIVMPGGTSEIYSDDTNLPKDFTILSSYPNPFNPSATISFGLENSGNVSLDIFDLQGRRVATLVNQSLLAGLHSVTWNGRTDSDVEVSSGIYFARLKTETGSRSIRMTLLK